MSNEIKFKIDGKECVGKQGQYITEAASDNKVYIPTLCAFHGQKPAGTCRICTVKVGGRNMAACTSTIAEGMEIENNTSELSEARKVIIEMLFAEGNHYCPTCEKSGSCDLQALAYRYNMLGSRFQKTFPNREVFADSPKLMLEHNRCILCKRCMNGIKTEDGKSYFAFTQRGNRSQVTIAQDLINDMTDEVAQKAMDICPVGAILKKEKGFDVPIGKRKYDKKPIGSDIESNG